jgi:hypothetical protein
MGAQRSAYQSGDAVQVTSTERAELHTKTAGLGPAHGARQPRLVGDPGEPGYHRDSRAEGKRLVGLDAKATQAHVSCQTNDRWRAGCRAANRNLDPHTYVSSVVRHSSLTAPVVGARGAKEAQSWLSFWNGSEGPTSENAFGLPYVAD